MNSRILTRKQAAAPRLLQLSVLFFLSAFAASAQAPAGLTGPAALPYNPLQVALLKWYGPYQSATLNSPLIGTKKYGMAFDGSSMWVTSESGLS